MLQHEWIVSVSFVFSQAEHFCCQHDVQNVISSAHLGLLFLWFIAQRCFGWGLIYHAKLRVDKLKDVTSVHIGVLFDKIDDQSGDFHNICHVFSLYAYGKTRCLIEIVELVIPATLWTLRFGFCAKFLLRFFESKMVVLLLLSLLLSWNSCLHAPQWLRLYLGSPTMAIKWSWVSLRRQLLVSIGLPHHLCSKPVLVCRAITIIIVLPLFILIILGNLFKFHLFGLGLGSNLLAIRKLRRAYWHLWQELV